jgi:hypothetical protein
MARHTTVEQEEGLLGKRVLVYSDERKKVDVVWDYHCLMIVEENSRGSFLEQLRKDRKEVGYQYELKFANLDSKAKGEKVELARKWMGHILEEADSPRWKIYFDITGVDNSNMDYSLFGEDASSFGKYATVYNRFFRASLQGMLKLFFPSNPVIVKDIYHDREGNLENHGYFEWHVITRTKRDQSYADFECSKVCFVDSDHRTEVTSPEAAEFIQFVDVLLGAVTYCIHVTNPRNMGQRKVAEDIFALVDEILRSPYKDLGQFHHFRRFTISHFPEHPIVHFDEEAAKGEYYHLRCDKFQSLISGQGQLFS